MNAQEMGSVESPSVDVTNGKFPDASWNKDRIWDYYQSVDAAEKRVDDALILYSRRKCGLRYRRGLALSLLRHILKPWGKWGEFCKEHGLKTMAVNRAIFVYENCADEKEASSYETLEALYADKKWQPPQPEPEEEAVQDKPESEAAHEQVQQQPEKKPGPAPVIYGPDNLPANRPAPEAAPSVLGPGIPTPVPVIIYGADGQPANRPDSEAAAALPDAAAAPSCFGPGIATPVKGVKAIVEEDGTNQSKRSSDESKGAVPRKNSVSKARKPVIYDHASLRCVAPGLFELTLRAQPDWLMVKTLNTIAVDQLFADCGDALRQEEETKANRLLATSSPADVVDKVVEVLAGSNHVE